jgi:hypothetical protein
MLGCLLQNAPKLGYNGQARRGSAGGGKCTVAEQPFPTPLVHHFPLLFSSSPFALGAATLVFGFAQFGVLIFLWLLWP